MCNVNIYNFLKKILVCTKLTNTDQTIHLEDIYTQDAEKNNFKVQKSVETNMGKHYVSCERFLGKNFTFTVKSFFCGSRHLVYI